MDLAKIPSTLQLGNVVLGAVDAFDLRRAEGHLAQYDELLAKVDAFLPQVEAMPPSQELLLAGEKLVITTYALLSSLKGAAPLHQPVTLNRLQSKKRKLVSAPPVATGPTGVGSSPMLAPQDLLRAKINIARNDLLKLREEAFQLRTAEAEQLAAKRVSGGSSGMTAPMQPGGPTIGYAVALGMVVACAYHGYARNKTITGALKWAAAPFFLGYVGGGIALAIAANQGFGKPITTTP
jgi:hypothetical protein